MSAVVQEQNNSNHHPNPPSNEKMGAVAGPRTDTLSHLAGVDLSDLRKVIRIRPARAGEMGYVLHSWTETTYGATPQKWACKKDIWYALFPKHQEYLLKRARVLVATPIDDDNLVCGFVIYEPQIPSLLHWVQVKSAFKKQGIAKLLLESAGIHSESPTVYTFPLPHFIKQPEKWQHIPHWLV